MKIRIRCECSRCPGSHLTVEHCNALLAPHDRECASPVEHHRPRWRLVITVTIR